MLVSSPHSFRNRKNSVSYEPYRVLPAAAPVFLSLFFCVSLFFGASKVLAQIGPPDVAVIPDPGIPDTISLSSADVLQGDHFRIQLSMVNDEELSGATIGIRWGTPDLILDSISYIGTRLEILPSSQRPATIDNSSLFAGLTGFFIFGPPAIQPGTGAFANFWFTVNPTAPDQFIDLDSAFFPPSGDFLLVTFAGNEGFIPQFVGSRIKIGNPSEPSTIDVNPGSFQFSAIEGAINPPLQSLNIQNIGLGTLNWSATFSASWLSVAPSSGTAPSVTQVTANSIGLGVGAYFDTILISDPNATNSPVAIPVELVVSPPPPTISVSQTTFFFNAIADSTNPPTQNLLIRNTTNGSLNWQATNSENWLTVTPTSGGDSTNVTLSVDIVGLPFGDYTDTIIITDPNATNDPVRVAVNLSVASDLPIIALDPDTLYVVVDLNSAALQSGAQLFDTAYFGIGNEGAGSMTYSLSESSSRIFSMTPSAGNAPDSIAVVFKLVGGSPGDVLDSILVSSPEAINSPQYEFIKYHQTFTPADIFLSIDTLEFTLFECEQGASFVPPIVSANFDNNGEPAPFQLEFSIDWLTAMQTFGTAPTSLGFLANETGLPLGVYLDSIKIVSPLSETNPQYLYVRLTVRSPVQSAVIFPDNEVFVIPAREGTNFQYGPIDVLQVRNFNGGCFNWTIEDSISWLNAYPLAGQNPTNVLLVGDGTNLTFGEYDSLLTVNSAEASNSPKTIAVKLQVWRLFGDADYNNRINVADAVYLIQYIFRSGPQPEPAIYVADVDCTGTVNIADASFLVNYIFGQGDTPCGNDGF